MPIPVQTLVTRACDLVGLSNAVGAPSPEDQALAVDCLNGLLGELSAEQLINPSQYTAATTATYPGRIVVGTDTSVETPDLAVDLMDVFQVTYELGQVVYPMTKIPLTEYERISVKTINAPPRVWAYDYQQPNANIWLYPIPLPGTLVRIVAMERIANIESQTTINLDMSYFDLLLYNLACRLYPFYPRDAGIDSSLPILAKKAREIIKGRISKMRAQRARTAFTTSSAQESYWTSTLNSVTI